MAEASGKQLCSLLLLSLRCIKAGAADWLQHVLLSLLLLFLRLQQSLPSESSGAWIKPMLTRFVSWWWNDASGG